MAKTASRRMCLSSASMSDPRPLRAHEPFDESEHDPTHCRVLPDGVEYAIEVSKDDDLDDRAPGAHAKRPRMVELFSRDRLYDVVETRDEEHAHAEDEQRDLQPVPAAEEDREEHYEARQPKETHLRDRAD